MPKPIFVTSFTVTSQYHFPVDIPMLAATIPKLLDDRDTFVLPSVSVTPVEFCAKGLKTGYTLLGVCTD